MKRSEMFKLLENTIYREIAFSSCKSEISVRATEAALKVMEEVGMLPPLNENSDMLEDMIDTVYDAELIYEWEEE